ncbi:uncharacterized protein LOC131998560 [Stomoxys calcitrans]|uniref:uncharacterized protein LOC131998560 n=1 Tax=Stomoxys calcitrans TaxID=35570 RepID=UPI0027E39E28|nr:uncharacterized protein LOC131998560 [Stomoxys calcitrans]
MASALNFPFERLRGRENFDVWRRHAKSCLVIKKCWKVVEKGVTGDNDNEANELALAEITLMIEPTNFAHIAKAKTAKEAWDSLVRAYEDTGLTRKVELLKQLVQLKLGDFSSMQEYVNAMILTSIKVNNAGLNINDEVTASLMLAGLPEEFQSLVMAVENSKTQLTVDSVKNLLLQDAKFDNEVYKEINSEGVNSGESTSVELPMAREPEIESTSEDLPIAGESENDILDLPRNAENNSTSSEDFFDSIMLETGHNDENSEIPSMELSEAVTENIQIRRSERIANRPKRSFVFSALEFVSNDPINLSEAISSPYSEEWKQAMKEYDCLIANKTWILTDLPPDKKPIPAKWGFKTKIGANNKVLRRKARLVAKGYSQEKGVDYNEIFAPGQGI